MVKTEVRVINQLGLHARAAAALVRLAGNFQSEIIIERTDNAAIADAKSILSVLTLAAAKETELKIEIKGSDENAAAVALEKIFTEGFGEI